ncbi:MAG: AraC family transcriptional regulator [Jatrophihabitantaceae bacterium]
MSGSAREAERVQRIVQRVETTPLGTVAWLSLSRETANDWPLTVRTGPLGLKIMPLNNSDSFYFRGARIRGLHSVLTASTVTGAELRRQARIQAVPSENTTQMLIHIPGLGSVFDTAADFEGAGLMVISAGREVSEEFRTNSHVCTLNVQQEALGIEPHVLDAMCDGLYVVTHLQSQLIKSAIALLLPGSHADLLTANVAAVDMYLAGLAALLLRTSVPAKVDEHERLPTIRLQTEAIIFAQASDVDLTPAAIAGQLAISLRQLYRAFDGVESPAACIRHRRLALAADLLTSQVNLTHVETIAQQCGFISAEYFSRAFRREYGMSPRAYRTANREASMITDR